METNKIDLDEIKLLIPHREPFLFIDKLINIRKLDQATGIKSFKKTDNFFNGHFPGHPVVPGVILIEMLAQTAAALIAFKPYNPSLTILFIDFIKAKRFLPKTQAPDV